MPPTNAPAIFKQANQALTAIPELAGRLGIPMPDPQKEPVHLGLGDVAIEWLCFWAQIGVVLAQKEPEFGPHRRGRNKQLASEPMVSRDSVRKRGQRERQELKRLLTALGFDLPPRRQRKRDI